MKAIQSGTMLSGMNAADRKESGRTRNDEKPITDSRCLTTNASASEIAANAAPTSIAHTVSAA